LSVGGAPLTCASYRMLRRTQLAGATCTHRVVRSSGLVRVIWWGSATAASQLTTVTQKVAPAGALC